MWSCSSTQSGRFYACPTLADLDRYCMQIPFLWEARNSSLTCLNCNFVRARRNTKQAEAVIEALVNMENTAAKFINEWSTQVHLGMV